MARYSLTVETTSNNTAGAADSNTAVQFLMPSAREAQLEWVYIGSESSTANLNSGRWVVDRITAVGSGSTLVPLKMEDTAAASAISDTTKTISTTVAATNTHQDVAIVDLGRGWNDLRSLNLRSGVNKGFGIRRATAPSGAEVVVVTAIYSEI